MTLSPPATRDHAEAPGRIDAVHAVVGAGPLGLAVARTLTTAGARVRLVTRSGALRPGLVAVETRAADLSRRDETIAALAGADVVHQCAAPPYHLWPTLFPALQDAVLEGAARAGAVVVAAENVYGYGVSGTLTEDLPLVARTRKGAVRAAMSERLLAAHRAGDARTVAVRASDFFGPGVAVSAFGERFWPPLVAGRSISWFGDPDVPHTATYLPDFARAMVRLAGEPAAWGRPWHAPSPPTSTVREIVARAARIVGVPPPRIGRTPAFVLRAIGLLVPAAGELVELAPLYDAPLVVSDAAIAAAFGEVATPWDEALRATLA